VFENIYSSSPDLEIDRPIDEINVISSTHVYSRSEELCADGYLRSEFTSS